MTARAGGYAEAQVPDIERRLASMLRLGTVSQLDYSDPRAPRVKVKAGKVTTGWIPWAAARAGRARTWSPLKVGEQVIMAAPSGDLAQAVIVGSIFYNDRPAPAHGESETVTEFDDGARQVYDEDSHTSTLTLPAGGTVVVNIGGTTWELTGSGARLVTQHVTIEAATTDISGDLNVGGGIVAQGDVIGEGVSLAHHVNTLVMAGPGNSGPPLKGG